MKMYIYKDKEYHSLDEIRRVSNTCFPDSALDMMGITVKETPQTTVDPLIEAKWKRAEAVANIKVTVDGMTFDGDEGSQTRMTRAVAVAKDGEKTAWVLADNTIAEVTKEQLQQALRLAGQEQTKLWVMPYRS